MNSKMKCDLALIISPNLGVMDSWLPIIRNLKSRNRQLFVTAIAPFRHTAAQFRAGDLMTELGAQTFDLVVARNRENVWTAYSDLKQAMRRKSEPKHDVAAGPMPAHGTFGEHWDLRAKKKPPLDCGVISDSALREFLGEARVILYDVAEERKAEIHALSHLSPHALRYSLPHGIDLRVGTSATSPHDHQPDEHLGGPRTIAYIQGDSEKPVYERAFNVPAQNIRPAGVPRHDESWINTVREVTGPMSHLPDRYALLVSRRHNPRFFPEERKRQALNDIRHVIMDEQGLDLVIRRHPRERDDNVFPDCLGPCHSNPGWRFADEHAFALATRAEFCVSFFSSVAVDMASLGVPVIERFDFGGLKDTPTSVQRHQGNITSVYQSLGLARGARNCDELRRHVVDILENKITARRESRSAYEANYALHPNPIARITSDIEHRLQKK